MSIFSKIKDAIFGKKKETSAVTPPVTQKPPVAGAGSGTATINREISEVDVEQQLDSRVGAEKLNWRTSIVDLMKLIGLDASYNERKELAQEMGRTNYTGTAEDNIWLHKAVMRELAKNGGKVPASLQD